MVSEYKLHIGSYGWQYESWNNSFYPDDLPMEWQFAYYANEYSVIMIPWNLIHDKFELLKQGLEDSEETCQLVLEMPLKNLNSRPNDEILAELEAFLTTISFIGSRCLALVLVINYSEIFNSSKLELCNDLLTICQAKIKTCIDLKEIINAESLNETLSEEFKAILENTGTELCRYNESTVIETNNSSSKLHITFCDVSNNDPKQMRKIVENSLLGECAGSTNVLIFRSDIPDHKQMNIASVISDLL